LFPNELKFVKIVFWNTHTHGSVEEVCYFGDNFNGAFQGKDNELTPNSAVSINMYGTYCSCITHSILFVRRKFLQLR
jgi:hypothetical protein